MSLSARELLQGEAAPGRLPQFTLRGSAYRRGVQYGRAVGPLLERFYYWFVQAEPAAVLTAEYRRVLEEAMARAADCHPLLLEHVRGWSDGSGIGAAKCELLAFHNEIRRALRPGCSNVVCLDGPEGPWLARNCDLFEHERSWQVRVTHQADDSHHYGGIGYLGLPGVHGLNSVGLAVGGASLPAARSENPAVFADLSGYLMMTQDSVRGCLEVIGRFRDAAQGHWALLDAGGDAAAVEAGSGRVHVRRAGADGFLVATNHSPGGDIPAPPGFVEGNPAYDENSRCRYARISGMMAAAPRAERTGGLAWRILADREGRWPVCEKVPGGFHTIHSFVARPGKGRLEYCWGYPGEAAVKTFRPGNR